jgi:hypothetical protein
MRYTFFLFFTQRRLVVRYRRFYTTRRSHLQGSSSPADDLVLGISAAPVCISKTNQLRLHTDTNVCCRNKTETLKGVVWANCRVLWSTSRGRIYHLPNNLSNNNMKPYYTECAVAKRNNWHGYVLHEGITYKSRVPRTSQMTLRLLRQTAAAMRAHNVLCKSYNTRPLLCARITCYLTVITHGRCYARA